MSESKVHMCKCLYCQQESDHSIKEQHQLANLFLTCLNKQQRRLYAALESKRLGRGSNHIVSQITGICSAAISRGHRELDKSLELGFINQAQPSIGGRPRIEEKDPNIKAALEKMLTDEVGGDPMSEQKWVRSSTRQLAQRLKESGHQVGHCTVLRFLKEMGFSMKANKKKIKVTADGAERDEQFR